MSRTIPPLLATGALLLALSLLVTLAAPVGSSPVDRGLAFAAWLQSASFWLGILCIAGHVLRLVLDGPPRGALQEPSAAPPATR